MLTSYLLLYRNKLNKLNPTGQRCYHINKLPSIIPLLPKFILFSIIKSQGKPLQYCKLELPEQEEEKKRDEYKSRPSKTINILNVTEENEENEKSKRNL